MTDSSNSKALEAKLLANRAKMLAFVRARLSDSAAAEDILQDSLIKAMRGLERLEDPDKLEAWFYQIVRNAIVDHVRSRNKEAKYVDEFTRDLDLHDTPEERAALCQCFKELIPELKDEYRVMIETMELGEGDAEQLADELNITRNNLKVRRHRARNQLRDRIEETCAECAARGCLDCTCEKNSNQV